MAKYKVLQKFRDTHTKEVYEKNDVIEMTDERANKAIENLKKYKGEFLERIADEPNEEVTEVESIDAEDMTVPQLKEVLDQLEIKYKTNAKREELLALLEGVQEETEKEGD